MNIYKQAWIVFGAIFIGGCLGLALAILIIDWSPTV